METRRLTTKAGSVAADPRRNARGQRVNIEHARCQIRALIADTLLAGEFAAVAMLIDVAHVPHLVSRWTSCGLVRNGTLVGGLVLPALGVGATAFPAEFAP